MKYIDDSTNFRRREKIWILILLVYTVAHLLLATLTLNVYVPGLLELGYDFASSVMVVLLFCTLSLSVVLIVMARRMDENEKRKTT